MNLDAELELACRGAYTPARLSPSAARARSAIARSLLGPADVLLDDRSEPGCARGYVGRAWCPTHRALTCLKAAGAAAPKAPEQSVLCRVNDKRFVLPLQASLGLPTREVRGPADLDDLLQAPSKGALLFKTPLGFAGRGQRRVDAPASPNDSAQLHRALAKSGLVVEPFRRVLAEFSLHGWLSRRGDLSYGQPCQQWCDAQRQWLRTRPLPAGLLTPIELRALRGALARAAEALIAASYFGPFGVDSYLWQEGPGRTRLNPLSELNARFSMGYAVGMRC